MSSHVSRLTFRFGEFECDGIAYALRRKGRRVRLARQPMDLLFLLLNRRGELVSREEIAKHLWSNDVFVDVDAGIRTAILKIRRALSDSHESSRFVETIPVPAGRLLRHVRETLWHVCWTDAEIRRALHLAGFDLIRSFDGLDVRPRTSGEKRGTDAYYLARKRKDGRSTSAAGATALNKAV